MFIDGSAVLQEKTIVIAGATGDLGTRIAGHLLHRGARVRALVRPGNTSDKTANLQAKGATVIEVDYRNHAELVKACAGGTCVVSALSGLEEVILDAQTALLQAAVEAGVPRFIPSDFAIDFTKLPHGTNRNLDLRQEFKERLDKAPIAATSVLNGMFSDLLTGQAPVVLFPLKRVVYWEDADQPLDFTTIEDTAAFTAAAALDAATPRYLRIAGDVLSARGLKEAASQATGDQFKLLKAGKLGRLDKIIKFTRTVFPQKEEVFPAWQGMQYMRNMFSGLPILTPLDNNRYPGIRWTTVQEVLAQHVQQNPK
ncbi:NmrA family NAD(P)-binding protein [Rufibacter hautae]|uniref:NAD(P)H-binding protein n=1 Tax=Rufibacter hautae TaxID=2595005 RepID=A0A5B6TKC4_9BACT|nr:NmrA family NAD(P)-binding protein [Rufibacter hautae]KAA3439837.1 NAD(P)H-binding protein [Rufibacter hautae]